MCLLHKASITITSLTFMFVVFVTQSRCQLVNENTIIASRCKYTAYCFTLGHRFLSRMAQNRWQLWLHPRSRLENSDTLPNLVTGKPFPRASKVVRASDLDREFDSRPVHCEVALVNSAFHPSGVGKSSASLLAAVKAGRIHLCRVAGNTV